MEMLLHQLKRMVGLKGRLPRDGLKEAHAKGVHVGCRTHLGACQELLRGHETEAAHHLIGLR